MLEPRNQRTIYGCVSECAACAALPVSSYSLSSKGLSNNVSEFGLGYSIQALSALIVRAAKPGTTWSCSEVYMGSYPRYCALAYL